MTAPGTTSVFAGFRFPPEVISVAVRWYLRYGLSYRDVEELLAERGVTVDHVTIYRWVQRFTPEFIEAARPCWHVPGNGRLQGNAPELSIWRCWGAGQRYATMTLGGAAVTTPSFSVGRESGTPQRGRLMADPETSGVVPVFDPWLVAGPADRSALMLAAGACWLASAVCITVMAGRGASVAWIIAWFTSTAAAVAVTRMADIRSSRRRGSSVIEPSSLDYSCRQLLRRAQLAVGTILGSEVYTADLLDRAAAETALRRHEWEIASTLREITALRAESDTSLRGASPGPMTDAVLESHRRALALAEQATTARVCALERYAAQVRVTDAARLDWQSAIKIAGLNDRYLDLLARTAADEQAIAEITALTEQAFAADEAFRESLRRATIAGEALVLATDDETP